MTLCPKTFRKWRDETQYLEKIDIPRYVEINGNSELQLLVDACKISYGACVYVRTVAPLGVKIRLIRERSRVAPLKTFDYSPAGIDGLLHWCEWSDSMVALWWLKNHGDWSVFVANRVNEINSLVPSHFWRHFRAN
ncbi:integrase catalytic domain-containing protein [Trichonephila inaurata madagascariensis]|uniref:Integrase catalytic domain-containing protein n=1 Tax=Trichonephila inaurata madagascariensis TaxID=2747483 RepID=A0A8X7C4T0_9ARAC|nr:integrase catalytic domain-containing protein [Trichonephila inaurata madagascariensis]